MSRVMLSSHIMTSSPPEVGSKAFNLARLAALNLPVVPFFVVTGLENQQELTPQLARDIYQTWDSLALSSVAVRSSAIGEDAVGASWAGQLRTFLGVTRDDLLAKIGECVASIHTQQTAVYSQMLQQNSLQKIAIIIQELVPSEMAGVMFTAHPITGNREQTVIEAILGLGELLAQGEVSSCHYELNSQGEIINRDEPDQEIMLVPTVDKRLPVVLPVGRHASLSSGQLEFLQGAGRQIATAFGGPQDIEWAWARGQFWFLQSRPITTL